MSKIESIFLLISCIVAILCVLDLLETVYRILTKKDDKYGNMISILEKSITKYGIKGKIITFLILLFSLIILILNTPLQLSSWTNIIGIISIFFEIIVFLMKYISK